MVRLEICSSLLILLSGSLQRKVVVDSRDPKYIKHVSVSMTALPAHIIMSSYMLVRKNAGESELTDLYMEINKPQATLNPQKVTN